MIPLQCVKFKGILVEVKLEAFLTQYSNTKI